MYQWTNEEIEFSNKLFNRVHQFTSVGSEPVQRVLQWSLQNKLVKLCTKQNHESTKLVEEWRILGNTPFQLWSVCTNVAVWCTCIMGALVEKYSAPIRCTSALSALVCTWLVLWSVPLKASSVHKFWYRNSVKSAQVRQCVLGWGVRSVWGVY